MQIKQITNEKLGETVYCAKHPSGLEIRVMPKAGYSSAYAVFGVKYGSIGTAVKSLDTITSSVRNKPFV